ncbi:MAG: hypothetical protein R3C59_16135 [Planctomycetaceae bacterium]
MHPFASSYRQPEHGDIKTDDNDLMRSSRGDQRLRLIEKPVDPVHQQLQILARHRRDLVKKKRNWVMSDSATTWNEASGIRRSCSKVTTCGLRRLRFRCCDRRRARRTVNVVKAAGQKGSSNG